MLEHRGYRVWLTMSQMHLSLSGCILQKSSREWHMEMHLGMACTNLAWLPCHFPLFCPLPFPPSPCPLPLSLALVSCPCLLPLSPCPFSLRLPSALAPLPLSLALVPCHCPLPLPPAFALYPLPQLCPLPLSPCPFSLRLPSALVPCPSPLQGQGARAMAGDKGREARQVVRAGG